MTRSWPDYLPAYIQNCIWSRQEECRPNLFFRLRQKEYLRYKKLPHNRHCETEMGYRERKGLEHTLLKDF